MLIGLFDNMRCSGRVPHSPAAALYFEINEISQMAVVLKVHVKMDNPGDMKRMDHERT
jgi:hypothetical protein